MTLPRVSAPTESALLIATRNAGKTRELRQLLARVGRPIADLRDAGIEPAPAEDALEDAPTFEGNALAKARYFARRSHGRAVLADDSGLCVAALGGAPGVRSRRYAGANGDEADVSAANCAKLLRAMAGVPDRRAEFVCAIAFVDGATELVVSGRAGGRILEAPVGAKGFGYDPLFWSDELKCSYGEASAHAKATVSHRARAINRLVAALTADGAGAKAGR